jgi:hypothetical protein
MRTSRHLPPTPSVCATVNRLKYLQTLILILVLVAVVNHECWSDTITWTNTSGGWWVVPANWSPNQVPSTNDIAVITNALSALRLLAPWREGSDVAVRWQSVGGVSYSLERSTNLAGSPAFTPLATNLPGLPGTTTCSDTNAAVLSPLHYRVGVGE